MRPALAGRTYSFLKCQRMKNLFFLLLTGGFFFLSTNLSAQSCKGVYLTISDFRTGKLTPVKAEKAKSLLCIGQAGTLSRVDKSSIYALKYEDGRVARSYNGGFYILLNPGETIPLYKVTLNSVSKGDVARTKYFFSKEPGSEIEALTTDNLKAAFAGDRRFEESLDLLFRADADLYAYDAFDKCYKLNRVYAITR